MEGADWPTQSIEVMQDAEAGDKCGRIRMTGWREDSKAWERRRSEDEVESRQMNGPWRLRPRANQRTVVYFLLRLHQKCPSISRQKNPS